MREDQAERFRTQNWIRIKHETSLATLQRNCEERS